MTSASHLISIPAGLAAQQSTWYGPPSRTAALRERDVHVEDGVVFTGVIVTLGEHELLQFTYLDPAQHAALEAEVAAFNANPDDVWAQMLQDVATRRLEANAHALSETAKLNAYAAERLPAPEFTFLHVDIAYARGLANEAVPTERATVQRKGQLADDSRVIVELPLRSGQLMVLFDGQIVGSDYDDLIQEVERLNADPATSLRALARDTLLAEHRRTAREIVEITERQSDDARLIGLIA